MRLMLLLVVIMFSDVVKSQDIFNRGVVVEDWFDYHVSMVPLVGEVGRSLMYMKPTLGIFPGLESTWMFKYWSPTDGGINEAMPSSYSGVDIGSCVIDDTLWMYLYPNPYLAGHYSNRRVRVTLLSSSYGDGHIMYEFSTMFGDIFLIESYPEKWMYKLVIPMNGGFMIYQVLSHRNKLRR